MEQKEFKRLFDRHIIMTYNGAKLWLFIDVIKAMQESYTDKKYRYFGKSCERYMRQ